MKEEMPQHEHYLQGHKDVKDISKLSEKLAPLEERTGRNGSERASRDDENPLDCDTGTLKLPQGFVENEVEKQNIFGLEPVIVVILILMLLFIAFITYLVYLMPGPVRR